MKKLPFIINLLLLPCHLLIGQVSFPDLVAAAFGSDQELINGIQFANHYGMVDGHPYFLDKQFRDGDVYIADQLYERMRIRYNLYSQKVEMEYQHKNGNLIQYMSVPELMPSFSIEGRTFERLQFGDGAPAYYQVVPSGKNACYIGWSKEMNTARNNSFRAYQFSAPKINYWLRLGQELRPFHNRKTFIILFPEQIQKEILQMLKQRRYSFKNATVVQAEEMILAALGIYEIQVIP